MIWLQIVFEVNQFIIKQSLIEQNSNNRISYIRKFKYFKQLWVWPKILSVVNVYVEGRMKQYLTISKCTQIRLLIVGSFVMS